MSLRRKVIKAHSDLLLLILGIICASDEHVCSNGYFVFLMNVFAFLSLVSGADGRCNSKRN